MTQPAIIVRFGFTAKAIAPFYDGLTRQILSVGLARAVCFGLQ
jgi:hypothetical protein